LYIRSLELHNFQKHEHFVAEFTDKVNVFYGETDAGKSCIIRAIKWVVNNEPKGDVVRKNGTKKTSVILTLNTGVSIERRKSESINAYVVTVNGEERKYDSVGRNIPDEVKQILNMLPLEVDGNSILLNIASQFEPSFMLDSKAYSPTFRMKVLNKLTGNDILDSVAQSINKDSLKLSRELKLIEEELVTKEESLKDLSLEKDVLSNRFEKSAYVYKSILKSIERYESAFTLRKQLNDIEDGLELTSDKIKGIKIPDEDKVKGLGYRIIKFESVLKIQMTLKSLDDEIEFVSKKLAGIRFPEDLSQLKDRAVRYQKASEICCELAQNAEAIRNSEKVLKGISLPDEKLIKSLLSRSEAYQKALSIGSDLKSNSDLYKTLCLKLEGITEAIMKEIDHYKGILKEYQHCPICHQKITDKILDEIKL